MKYTKQEVDAMQDSEINACLAAKYFPESAYVESDKVFYSEKNDGDNVTSISTVFDFNNWQCIMPLATGQKVDLLIGNPCTATISAATYFMSGYKYALNYADKSPQRAIACCLLMMSFNPQPQ